MKLTDYDVKKLTQISLENGKINSEVAEFVMTKFTKKNLKIYKKYLTKEISRQTVVVKTANVDFDLEKKLKEHFAQKQIIIFEDNSLGAGMRIQQDDIIIDLTVKNMIHTTVKNVKAKL